jgi:Galactose oxidase-like, Early set domain/Glyoxal oxidase N-terminus/PKD domain/Divergent InlB B-repeat domain
VSAKIFRNLERPLLVARFGCSATLNPLWITARVFAHFRPDRDGPILAHSFLLYGLRGVDPRSSACTGGPMREGERGGQPPYGSRRRRLAAATVVWLVLAFAALPGGVRTARAQPQVEGQWATLPYLMPINPIHAGLLRTGKVLVIAGSENDPSVMTHRWALWDPQAGTITVDSTPWDLFCNGLSFLPDGRALVTGGTEEYDPFYGLKTTTIFDPVTERFIQVQDMAHGRWYPTNTALGDGGTAVFSGTREKAVGGTNKAIEIYDVPYGWSPEYPAPWTPPLYPRTHLLPSGKLFFAGAQTGSHLYEPSSNTWQLAVATTRLGLSRSAGTSVLLPLRAGEGYKPRVMIAGGRSPATDTVEVIDLSEPSPVWNFVQPMSWPRIQLSAVLLPTGKVLVLGGAETDNVASTAALAADLYDPDTGTRVPAGMAAFPRMYHSVALLLPDGRVWAAGSNPARGVWEPRMEVYSPAYLFAADGSPAARPTISGSPGVVGYGTSFDVATPNTDIASVVLIRPGAPTHAFDMEQRLVTLAFQPGSGKVTATAPPDGNVAPPGYYMLFLVNSFGVPSFATFVQLSPTPANQPPAGTILTPASDVTIAAGQSLTFSGEGIDPDGAIASRSWIFPGGTPGTSSAEDPGAVTFPTVGTYTVSLTVVDNDGANDPSPPTRTVSVVPGFTLTAATAGGGTGTVTSGDGKIVCPGDCSELYAEGAQVTLTAAGTGDSTFGGWSGACSSTTPTCTVTMTIDGQVSATFNPATSTAFTLTVSKSGSGTVTSGDGKIVCPGDCSESYSGGTAVILTATAGKGAIFAGWSGGGCSGLNPSCTLPMTANTAVSAKFKRK